MDAEASQVGDDLSKLDIQQDSPLIRLSGALRNRIYDYALPANATVILYAERRQIDNSTLLRFYPRQPALTMASRQLRKETFDLYYSSNTFVFSDSMLQQGVLQTFKAAQPGATKMKRIKTFHTFETLRHWNDKVENFTVRFAARTTDQNGVEVTDIRASGGQQSSFWRPGMREGFCCCFIEGMARNWSSQTSEDGALLQFIGDYLVEVVKKTVVGGVVCVGYGRLQAL